MKKLRMLIILMFLPSLVIVFYSACVDYEEEAFSISSLDAQACEYLTRELYPADTLYTEEGEIDTILVDTVFKAISTSLLRNLVDTTWASASDSTIISTFFDSLSVTLDSLIVDTILRMSFPTEGDTSYAFFDNSGYNGSIPDLVLFVDDFITIDIVRGDGTTVSETTTRIPLETIVGCTQVVETAGNEEVISVIKTRYSFELEQSTYLVRFIISDTTGNKPFLMVILGSD